MDITTKVEGNKTYIFVSGDIDIRGADKLKTSLDSIMPGDNAQFILDFAQVKFIGSSGIGKLLMAYKDLTARGGRISIINANKAIVMAFQDAKLDKLFNI